MLLSPSSNDADEANVIIVGDYTPSCDDEPLLEDEVTSTGSSTNNQKKYLLQNCFLLAVVFASVLMANGVFQSDQTNNNNNGSSLPQQQSQSRLLKRKRGGQQHEVQSLTRLTCPKRFNKTAEQMVTEISHIRPRNWQRLCQPHSRHCHCHAPTRMRPPSKIDGRDEDTLKWFGSKWEKTSKRNAEAASQPPPNGKEKYDVVFLGDSITEHFQGSDLLHVGPNWIETKKVFDQYFNTTMGGQYDGIALGIGGDMAPQIQYRLNHELPPTLDAKVFWILVGTNDVGYAKCNPEATASGNIKIVEMLLHKYPNSKVVLNSFLPRGIPGTSLLHRGDYPLWEMDASIINQWLECYAASPESLGRVDFFNATDYFLDYGKSNPEYATNETLRNTYPILVPEYYADGVHPSGKGCQKWLEGVVSHLENNMGMEAQR